MCIVSGVGEGDEQVKSTPAADPSSDGACRPTDAPDRRAAAADQDIRPARRAFTGLSWSATAVAIALAAPLFVNRSPGGGYVVALPRIHSGDEPHYLVMLNSLLTDGDLDLRNDYDAASKGGRQAGVGWAGQPLLHHTAWCDAARCYDWVSLFEPDTMRWRRQPDGRLDPVPRTGAPRVATDAPEYSQHPPGLALILAPLLLPLRETRFVEPAAIACATAATILALFCFRMLLGVVTRRRGVVDVVSAATFLGTPIWHYARGLWTEPFLLLFAVGAYAWVLGGTGGLLPGCMIAAGMLMKPPFAVLLAPLAAYVALRRDRRALVALTAPPTLACALILVFNARITGSPWRPPLPFMRGDLLAGMTGFLVSWKHGLVGVAPIMLTALIGWPALCRRHRAPSIVAGAGFLAYFVIASDWITWHGAYSYGTRLLVPIIPLLALGLVGFLEGPGSASRIPRAGFALVLVLSLSINMLAAFEYAWSFDRNPLLDHITALRSRVAAPSDARFVHQSVPASMVANGSYEVTIVVENTGRGTWIPDQGIALGSQEPADNLLWGMGRLPLSQAIAPRTEATFHVWVRAPSTPGTYPFRWRMVHDGVAWFGEPTERIDVVVRAP